MVGWIHVPHAEHAHPAEVSLSLGRLISTAIPEISVVVSTRDREQRLRALLGALSRQTLEPDRFEVIVVDNGSEDGTARALDALAGDCRYPLTVVRRSRGDGPAPARNEGWRSARAPLVAFTDDDCEPAPGWLLGDWPQPQPIRVR